MATSNGTRTGVPVSKASVPAMAEIGTTGLRHNAGIINEEWLRSLDSYRGIRTYQEMCLDPIVGSMISAIVGKLRRVSWDVEAADESQDAEDVAEFVEECMNDMSHDWESFIAEALTMLPFGWSYHEIVYKVRRGDIASDPGQSSDYTDGRIGWRKMPIRAQETLNHWEIDDEGGIAGMWQLDPQGFGMVLIPIQKALLFRPTAHKNNPQGLSALRTAYIPWRYRKRAQEVEAIGYDRDMVGIPKIGVPAEWLSTTATDSQRAAVAEYRRIGEQSRQDEQACLVWPLAYDANGNQLITYELLAAPGQKIYNVNEVIDRYNQEILSTSLADVIMVGHGSTGSYSMVKEKYRAFNEGLEGWLRAVAAIMNRHAIPRLLKLNNIDPKLTPEMKPGEIDQADLEILGKWLTALAGAGVALTPNDELEAWLFRAAGMPWTPPDQRPESATPTFPVPQAQPAAPLGPDGQPLNQPPPANAPPGSPPAQPEPIHSEPTAKGDEQGLPFGTTLFGWIEKFNSAHDRLGRFGTSQGSISPIVSGPAKTPGAPTDVTMRGLDAKTQAAAVATWEHTTGVSVEQGHKNLQDAFDAATPAERESGKRWYSDAHDSAQAMADRHGVDLETAIGVTAALSPGAEWGRNKKMADTILGSSKRHPELDAERLAHVAKVEGNLGTPHGYDPLIKASRIAKGEAPGDVLTGAKVRSFYNNIRDPSDARHITIDSHMFDAMYGGNRKGPGGVLIAPSKNKITAAMGGKELPKGWKAQTPAGADFVSRNPVMSSLTSSPKSQGRTIGVLPIAADGVRKVTAKHNAAHPNDKLTPAQTQAIIWSHQIAAHPAIESRLATDAAIGATAQFYGAQL